uniref:Uncharacterized protein n=1 Tax=Arion vulgaris TaxID=1028688 RepID=A0A0B7AM40_9EUPU
METKCRQRKRGGVKDLEGTKLACSRHIGLEEICWCFMLQEALRVEEGMELMNKLYM